MFTNPFSVSFVRIADSSCNNPKIEAKRQWRVITTGCNVFRSHDDKVSVGWVFDNRTDELPCQSWSLHVFFQWGKWSNVLITVASWPCTGSLLLLFFFHSKLYSWKFSNFKAQMKFISLELIFIFSQESHLNPPKSFSFGVLLISCSFHGKE